MGVPIVIIVRPSRVQLDEADTPFHQASRQQTAAAKLLRARLVDTVEFPRGLRFAAKIHRLRCMPLHVEGEFIAGETGGQIGIVGMRRRVLNIVVA